MVQLFTFTKVGGHRVNEDSFAARVHSSNPECWIACLADGQGGRAGGARASQLACEIVVASASARRHAALSDSQDWQAILAEADRGVATDREAGFTTLIGLCIQNNWLVGASCGDSAVVVVSQGSVEIPTSRQFKNPPVGSGEADFIPFEMKLKAPWRVLVVSDGVWKYCGWDAMSAAALNTGGDVLLSHLQSIARLPGSGAFPDDFTVVLIESQADSNS